jgi:hypothetical protein
MIPLLKWKGLKFKDISESVFELTHKTGKLFTVKIHKFPENEGSLTIANPKYKLSNAEFVMTEKGFLENLKREYITIL